MLSLRAALAAGLVFASTTVALAHPHVWVSTKSVVVFDTDGRVVGIRHAWTFDEGYSAYATQGMDQGADGKPKPEKLAELAKVNVESLAEQAFFTVAKANGAKQEFAEPRDEAVTLDGGRLTLSYLLPLKVPVRAPKAFALQVYDPTFFVDFAIADSDDAVRLDGAPKGCALNVRRPKIAEASGTMSESFFSALTAASTYGAQFSSSVLVACP